MNIINKIKNAVNLGRKKMSIALFPSWLKNKPHFKTWEGRDALYNGMTTSTWAYRCIQKRAESVASVPWYVEEYNSSEEEWQRNKDHPLNELLKKPNPHMSGRDLFQYLMMHLDLAGNGLWHKVMVDNGQIPAELWPVLPYQVSPVPSNNFIDYYEVVDAAIEQYGKRINADEIIHAKFNNPADPLWGLKPLAAASEVMQTDAEAIRWNKLAMENRAVSSGAFVTEQNLTKEQWEEQRERIQEQYSGAENARTPWLLSGGVTFEDLGQMTPKEMDFIDSRRFNMYEIHAVYGVDPLLTGAPDPASRANKQEARRVFWEDTIIPLLVDIKSLLNLRLASHFGDNIRLQYDISNVPALKESVSDKVENAERLFNIGFELEQINDRLELGFEEVPDVTPPPQQPGGSQGIASIDVNQRGKRGSAFKSDNTRLYKYWLQKEAQRDEMQGEITGDIADIFVEQGKQIEEEVLSGAGRQRTVLLLDDMFEKLQTTVREKLMLVVEMFGNEAIDELLRGENAYQRVSQKQGNDDIIFPLHAERIKEWINTVSTDQSNLINDHTKEVVAGIFEETAGQGLSSEETARELRDRFERMAGNAEDIDHPRAMKISRTLTTGGSNYGHYEGARHTSQEIDTKVAKTWSSAGDGRVRESHVMMNGETQDIDDLFSNGLMYPGDIERGAGYQVINCRCTEVHETFD